MNNQNLLLTLELMTRLSKCTSVHDKAECDRVGGSDMWGETKFSKLLFSTKPLHHSTSSPHIGLVV